MPIKRGLLQEDIAFTTTLPYGSGLTQTTLQAAITALGSARTVLSLAPGAWTLASSITCPATMRLHIPAGATVQINTGVTLTVYEYEADLPDWRTGSGTFTHVRYPDMATYIGWKYTGATGGQNRTLAAKLTDSLSVADFGMLPSVANNSSVFQAAVTAASTTGKALRIPAGVYPFTTTLTISVPNVHLIGEGLVVLQHTGTGTGMVITGETAAPYRLYNVHVENLTLQGNANTTQAFLWRDAFRCTATRLKARDCDYGFSVNGCQGCAFESLSCSALEAAFTYKSSAAGLYVTSSPNTGSTAQCTFRDLRFESLVTGAAGRGIHVNQGEANLFAGGVVSGCRSGIYLDAGASNRQNVFESLTSTTNVETAAVVLGVGNRFTGCRFISTNAITIFAVSIGNSYNVFESCFSTATASYTITSGVGNTFRNCYIPYALCTVNANLPSFYDCAFDSNPTYGLQTAGGPGTVRARNCWRVDGNLAWVSTYTDA